MSRRRRIATAAACVAAALVVGWPTRARAHKPSDSYLTLRVGAGAQIEARWDIALRDLDYALGLDADGDGAITWGELRARHADIARHALERLVIRGDGEPCPTVARTQGVVAHSDGRYDVLQLTASCARAPTQVSLEYRLFFDLDPQHRGLLRVDGAQGGTAIFSADRRTVSLVISHRPLGRELAATIADGVRHIWSGLDHLLFLLALLLPSVLRRDGARWAPVRAFRPALWDVLRIVSAFTVAHSITLSLAALGVVQLPSRFVESAIAASVVLAALNNLLPLVGRDRWLAAFALGLLHGFGFWAALADLGLSGERLVLGLFGFNVGVEIGQCLLVAAFVPVAFVLRRSWIYHRLALVAGSVLITAVAAAWLAERALMVRLFG